MESIKPIILPTVFFHYTEKGFRVKDTRKIKGYILKIFRQQKVFLQRVDYIFCSDEYLLQINRASLNRDYYTDTITFALNENNKPVVGEVYISFERVRENARTYKVSGKKELLRVIFHGALHLCGLRDKKKADKQKMTEKENLYLKEYNNVSRNTVSS